MFDSFFSAQSDEIPGWDREWKEISEISHEYLTTGWTLQKETFTKSKSLFFLQAYNPSQNFKCLGKAKYYFLRKSRETYKYFWYICGHKYYYCIFNTDCQFEFLNFIDYFFCDFEKLFLVEERFSIPVNLSWYCFCFTGSARFSRWKGEEAASIPVIFSGLQVILHESKTQLI